MMYPGLYDKITKDLARDILADIEEYEALKAKHERENEMSEPKISKWSVHLRDGSGYEFDADSMEGPDDGFLMFSLRDGGVRWFAVSEIVAIVRCDDVEDE